jgi:hypothetical protein
VQPVKQALSAALYANRAAACIATLRAQVTRRRARRRRALRRLRQRLRHAYQSIKSIH